MNLRILIAAAFPLLLFAQPSTPINNARLQGTGYVVTGASLSAQGTGTITATAMSNSTTMSGALDLLGSTRGSVLYRGASGWTILAPGTAGYVLATGGAGSDPYWAAGGGGGGGSPGGSNGQIQYNNAGAFGGFTMSGDATVNTSTGALTLANSGVSAGTYGSTTAIPIITVDAKGRVTATSNATPAYLPLAGGTMTGNITFSDAGEGIILSGSATLLATSGAVGLTAGGSNQSVYLTPSGTGNISMVGPTALQSGTSVTTSGAGHAAFDTNAWTSGRGAVQVYDGTANTFLIGALASDTPLNGQVPTFNTDGTITWETPSTGSGNVTASGVLASGNIIIGGGTTVVTATNITVSGGNNIGNVGTINATTVNATAITGITVNRTLYSNSAGNLTASAAGTSGQAWLSGGAGAAPDYGAVNLGGGASIITGTLPIANGGTGAATTSQNYVFAGPTSGSGAPDFRALVAGDIPSLSGTYLPLAGGTLTGNLNVVPTATPSTAGTMNIGELPSNKRAQLNISGSLSIDAVGFGPTFFGRRYNGSSASPTAVTSGQTLLSFEGLGYDGSAFTTAGAASIRSIASENWSTIANGAYINFLTTANGVVGATEKMRLLGDGTLQSAASSDFILRGGNSGGATINIGSGSSGNITLTAVSTGNTASVVGNLTVSGQSAFSDNLGVTKSLSGVTQILLSNPSSNASAQSRFSVSGDVGTLYFATVSSAFSGSGLSGNDSYIWTATDSGLSFGTNTTERLRLNSSVFSSTVPIGLLSSAAPSTGTAGYVAFDNNAWASGRGAIQVNDGTANTYVLAALASDTPSNAQVPKWNTGGTITWEDTVEKIAVFSLDGGGSAITTGTVPGTSRIPFACTLTGYSITATGATGTITIKIWLKASATTIPTVSDSINTSGVSLTTGTAVASSTLTDFTDTTYAALDMARCSVTAVDGTATDLTVTLYGTRL